MLNLPNFPGNKEKLKIAVTPPTKMAAPQPSAWLKRQREKWQQPSHPTPYLSSSGNSINKGSWHTPAAATQSKARTREETLPSSWQAGDSKARQGQLGWSDSSFLPLLDAAGGLGTTQSRAAPLLLTQCPGHSQALPEFVLRQSKTQERNKRRGKKPKAEPLPGAKTTRRKRVCLGDSDFLKESRQSPKPGTLPLKEIVTILGTERYGIQ